MTRYHIKTTKAQGTSWRIEGKVFESQKVRKMAVKLFFLGMTGKLHP